MLINDGLWHAYPWQVARDEAAAGRQGTAWEGEELTRLRDQLSRAKQRAADLEQELASEREALTRFRSAERTVVDLTTGMSVEAKRQIEELQKRLNVLERQNRQLKRSLEKEDGGGSARGGGDGGGGGGDDDGNSGKRSSVSAARRPTSSGSHRCGPPLTPCQIYQIKV